MNNYTHQNDSGGFMKYVYDGPVTERGKEISRHWHGETTAPSLSKAQNNLRYQFNKQYNRMPCCKVEFDTKKIQVN